MGFVLGVPCPRLVSCEVSWGVLIPVRLTSLGGCVEGPDSWSSLGVRVGGTLPAAGEPQGHVGVLIPVRLTILRGRVEGLDSGAGAVAWRVLIPGLGDCTW